MTTWYVDRNRAKVTMASVFSTVTGGKSPSVDVFRINDSDGFPKMTLFCSQGAVISQAKYDAAVAENSASAVPADNTQPGRVDTPRLLKTRLISAATINATVAKSSGGGLVGLLAYNANAAVRFLKLYDKATAPAPASDSALLLATIALEPGRNTRLELAPPLPFLTGLGFALVTGIADTDATAVAASEIVVNLFYL